LPDKAFFYDLFYRLAGFAAGLDGGPARAGGSGLDRRAEANSRAAMPARGRDARGRDARRRDTRGRDTRGRDTSGTGPAAIANLPGAADLEEAVFEVGSGTHRCSGPAVTQ
jgi:hypothetical protein